MQPGWLAHQPGWSATMPNAALPICTIGMCPALPTQGEMAAMFLRHEGFLGAVGAFMKVQALQGPGDRDARKVGCRAAGGVALCAAFWQRVLQRHEPAVQARSVVWVC